MLIAGATAYIAFSLADETGPIDLTQSRVDFIFRQNEFDTPVSKVCEITDGAAGLCSIVLTPQDLDEHGSYYYQLKITFPDFTVMKSELVTFYVEASLEEPS